jgi:hypothetical protein
MMEKEKQLHAEFDGKYMSLEQTVKGEIAARMGYEADIRRLLDERWRNYRYQYDLGANL